MATDDSVHMYLFKAEQALNSGDRPAAVSLINQVLKLDFTNDRAWKILYRLLGANQVFEVFQYKFAQNNYPDKLHLLTSIPEWMSEIEEVDTTLQEEPIQKSQSGQPVLSRPHNPTPNQTQYQPGFYAQIPLAKESVRVNYPKSPITQSHSTKSKYQIVVFVILMVLLIPAIFYLEILSSKNQIEIQPPIISITFTSFSPIVTITPTPFQPSTSITFTSSPPIVNPISDPLPDPIGFIYRYYNYINNRDYASAWSYLSVNYIDKMSNKVGHSFSYSNDYVAYWDTVAKIDILEVNLESINSQSAVLFFKLRWNMFDGSSLVYNHRFYLVRNSYTNSWLIDFVETWE